LDTLYLDPDAWDLALDASGNIAMASEPYSLAQDAASAVRTFQNEVYYDTTLGVPYFSELLNQMPPLSLLKSSLVTAAMTVPGVVSAQVFISGIADRVATGQVQVTDQNGIVSAASF
jgi:hypothetical protein